MEREDASFSTVQRCQDSSHVVRTKGTGNPQTLALRNCTLNSSQHAAERQVLSVLIGSADSLNISLKIKDIYFQNSFKN